MHGQGIAIHKSMFANRLKLAYSSCVGSRRFKLSTLGKVTPDQLEREREREIHYVHSASLAYEDGIVFMSEPAAARQ